MSLTQDNGSLGLLGVCRYFAALPQSARRKTLLFCIDTRHFIEGGDFSPENWPHDPYQVFPELVPKVTATIGLEHMGEMEARENYETNRMEPTGLPELTFMRSDDNDFCARILIEAAVVVVSNLILGVEEMPLWYDASLVLLGYATLVLFDLALTKLITLYVRKYRDRLSRLMN
jgi:hypothetical protein